jgi:hypothetical protein
MTNEEKITTLSLTIALMANQLDKESKLFGLNTPALFAKKARAVIADFGDVRVFDFDKQLPKDNHANPEN